MNAIVEHKDNVTAIVQVIERAALNPDVDVAKMERLLDMQERILQRQAAADFSAAMMAAQTEMQPIVRNKTNNQTSSNYADLEQVDAAIRPIYTRHGFSLTFGESKSDIEGYRRITCKVNHIGGHSDTAYMDLPLDDEGIKGSKNKTATHATGSTMSYGRRYLTMMIFNLVTVDDDGNSAQRPVRSADQVADDWYRHNDIVKAHWSSITAIKEALAAEAWEAAAEAMAEIGPRVTDTNMRKNPRAILARAPTKGGIFTVEEMKIMRDNKAFREALQRYDADQPREFAEIVD